MDALHLDVDPTPGTRTPDCACPAGNLDHTSVYRLFDAGDQLLYVGITWRISSRWAKHRRKPWWPQVRCASVLCFGAREEAADEEAFAIRDESPLHNIARPKVAA